jgi:hypothetical protein
MEKVNEDEILYQPSKYSFYKRRKLKRKMNQQHRKDTRLYFESIVERLNDKEDYLFMEDIDINVPVRKLLKYM